MQIHSHIPAPPLSTFVDRFWLCVDGQSNHKERILPSATLELVFNLREDEIRIYDPAKTVLCRRYSGAVVSGPYGQGFVIDASQHSLMLGVHFKPGGAVPFLGMPVSEVANHHVNLTDIWGAS